MKQKIITIKSKNKSGFTRTLGEVEFSQMIDKDNFEIIEQPKPKPVEKPAETIKKAEPVKKKVTKKKTAKKK